MEAEMDGLCDKFILAKLEREEIMVEPNSLEGVIFKESCCLVAKLTTCRPFNQEALKFTMRKVWRPAKSIRFHELGVGMMQVEFEDKLDKERVIRESP